jgi:CheY-like chemotaxis protein
MAAKQTLLIVEDDAIAREGLGGILRREGYDVILTADGEEALACLRSDPRPTLILLDMLMPVLDGWHFLQQMHAEDMPRIPILVMTATVLSRQWAEDHGCCGFLKKPLDPDALLAEIRRCFTRNGG